jgi:hypothetical protein
MLCMADERDEIIMKLINVFEKLRKSLYGSEPLEDVPKTDVTARNLADAIEKARKSIVNKDTSAKDVTIRDLTEAIKKLREGIYGL